MATVETDSIIPIPEDIHGSPVHPKEPVKIQGSLKRTRMLSLLPRKRKCPYAEGHATGVVLMALSGLSLMQAHEERITFPIVLEGNLAEPVWLSG